MGAASEGDEGDATGSKGVGSKGGNEGRPVAGGDQVDEGFERGSLHRALETAANVAVAVFGAAGGECVIGEAVSVCEDEEFVFQGLFVELLCGSEAVIAGQGGEEGFVEEDDFGDLRGVGFGGEEGGIELVVAEVVDEHTRLIFPEFDRQARETLFEGLQDEGKKVGRQGGDRTEFERADERVASCASYGFDLRGFGEGPPRVLQYLAARRSERYPFVGAFEQSDPEFLFKLLDLAAESGLTDVTSLSRPAEVALL